MFIWQHHKRLARHTDTLRQMHQDMYTAKLENCEKEQVLLHHIQRLISDCKTWQGQSSESEGWSDLICPRWNTFAMAGTEGVIECHNSWLLLWQHGKAPAGETCLKMRISESERSLEGVQNDTQNPCQVVVLGSTTHVKMHGCNPVYLWG